MLKKFTIAFVVSITFLFSLQVFANFSSISEYYLFFQNKNTQEMKYIYTKTYQSRFFFNYYFLKNINKIQIGSDTWFQNWKLSRVEENNYDSKESEAIRSYVTWELNVRNFWLDVKDSDNIFSGSLSDVSGLQKLGFDDITPSERQDIYFQMFLDFFWIWFLLFLPLNLVVFFCFWYLLFLLYERFSWKFFRYVYFNSFAVYLLVYSLLIFNELSFFELSSIHVFWMWTYFLIIGLPKLIIYFFSLRTLAEYHKKYPEKKVYYKKVLLGYLAAFALFIIFIQIATNFYHF